MPGDTPGFPVLITQPGSYRLSGNLTVPANVSGIVIAADYVTLDLNAFRIAGGGSDGVSAFGVSTASAQVGIAVRNDTHSNGTKGGVMRNTSLGARAMR